MEGIAPALERSSDPFTLETNCIVVANMIAYLALIDPRWHPLLVRRSVYYG